MKKISFLLIIMLFPIMVNATNQNSSVYSGKNVGVCTRDYQDNSVSTDGAVYFSHCMKATCTNRSYNIYYYDSQKRVKCSNGNTNPYSKVINNETCSKLKSTTCNDNEITYCSMVVYYDCSKLSNGESFNTTTKSTTTKTTYKKTTVTTTTTEKIKGSTKLLSLTLSYGTIFFNSDTYEYELEIENDIDSINVSAVPEDSTSSVRIEGNTELENDSIIKIIVTNTDNDQSAYSIKIIKKESKKLSNNANLKSLKIRNHTINFNSNITSYSVIIDNNEEELDIYEVIPEDSNATVEVNNNINLTEGSKISIVVKAEDGETTKIYNLEIRVKKQSNFLKILFIILVISSIIAGCYYIYKKIDLNRSGDKYEYE